MSEETIVVSELEDILKAIERFKTYCNLAEGGYYSLELELNPQISIELLYVYGRIFFLIHRNFICVYKLELSKEDIERFSKTLVAIVESMRSIAICETL